VHDPGGKNSPDNERQYKGIDRPHTSQQRTKKRAMSRLAEVVTEECPQTADSYLSILQVEAENEATQFVRR